MLALIPKKYSHRQIKNRRAKLLAALLPQVRPRFDGRSVFIVEMLVKKSADWLRGVLDAASARPQTDSYSTKSGRRPQLDFVVSPPAPDYIV